MKAIKYSFLLLVLAIFMGGAAKAQIVVIVNNDNPAEKLSAQQVKDYYMRKSRSRWPSINKPIKPVDRKGSGAEKTKFLSDVMGMSNEKLSQHFTQRQFANSEAPPAKFASDEEIINNVANEIGAIGFVSKAVYDANASKVKSVLVVN